MIPTPRKPISKPAMVLHLMPKKAACQERVVPKPTKSRPENMISVYITARTALTDKPTLIILRLLCIVSLLLLSMDQTIETT
jgi:hypothetical protein